jgi:Flp pilus assembly protein TadG
MIMRKATKGNSDSFRKRRAIMIAKRIPVCDDKGQAFVELALVLPIFILLLIGGVEVGRLAYADIEVSNAARAGVAYAMQNHGTAALEAGPAITAAANRDAPNISNLVVDPPILTCYCETTAGVTTLKDCTTVNTGSTGAGACASPSVIVEYVQVNTHALIDTAFHFPGIPSQVTLRGKAIMRVEF